jgi:pimeloyl-ACP methyl ester carboxylesterase
MQNSYRQDVFQLTASNGLALHLKRQRTANVASLKSLPLDVVYVHGSSFGSDLSIFYRFDDRSWADALNDAGFNAWGFDLIGYGQSDRYKNITAHPLGHAGEALPQLEAVIETVLEQNGNQPIVLLAHSWGSVIAAQYVIKHPQRIEKLVLFGPVVKRMPDYLNSVTPVSFPAQFPLSVWAQYRRFVEDVPRGQVQVLSEAHMQSWGAAFLASDPTANQRMPPSVMTSGGPLADLTELWSGKALYEAERITMPTLIVRGEWDSVCNNQDAATLLASIGTEHKRDCKIERATHLMHLETQRVALYQAVNDFLIGVNP